MVVFHSYVSLPEGTTCSPASRRSLGPERHVVYWVSLAERSCGSKPRRLATWFTSRGYPWPLQCPRDKLVITIVFMGIISWFMLQSHVYIYTPYAPWCCYIYLQNWVILFGQMLVNIPAYSSTMEHMDTEIELLPLNIQIWSNLQTLRKVKKTKQTIKQG